MSRRLRCLGLACAVLAWLLPAGAVHAADPPPPPEAPPLVLEVPDDPFAGLAERFRRMAQRDEAAKDWHRAVMRWEAVAAMEPQNRDSRQRIASIRRTLKEQADRHFATAKEALGKKQYAKAFREFLRTLSYDPDNSMALAMVKHELNAKSTTEYTVKRGDTLREIAQENYGDGDLTYLVQYYNDVRNPRDLKIGQVLRVPVIAGISLSTESRPARKAPPRKRAPRKAPAPTTTAKAAPAPKAPEPPAAAEAEQPAQNAGAAIVAQEVQQEEAPAQAAIDADEANSAAEAAEALLRAGKLDQAAEAAETVLEEDPVNSRAREVVNAAYYQQGKKLHDRKQDVAAMQMLARVDPGYQDVAELSTAVRSKLSGQEAEVQYIAGVTAFLAEDLDGAIRAWEQTLKLDPNHPQATKDLENARTLRSKLAQVR